jgi:hypothetical protein
MDIWTLSIVPVPILCGIGAVLATVWYVDRRQAAACLFALGCASMAGGYFLIGLRGLVPAFLTIMVANTLFAGSFILIWRGVRCLAQLPARPLIEFGLLAALVVVFLHYTYEQPDIQYRIIVFSLYMAGIGTLSFFDALRIGATKSSGPTLSLVFLIGIVMSFLRAAGTVLEGKIQTFPASGFQIAMYFVPVLICAALAYVTLQGGGTDGSPGLRPHRA